MTARLRASFLFVALLFPSLAATQDGSPGPVRFRVFLEPALASAPVSGRLLVFMTASAKPLDVITPGFGLEAKDVWIVAKEVHRLAPGDSIVVGAEDIAYPQPLSRASPGDYQVMALLDTDHNAAYTGMTSAEDEAIRP